MSEQVTLKQVGVDLRKMGEDGQWSWTLIPMADALDAHLAQHTAMVAKLRELAKQMNSSMHEMPRIYGLALDDILSTEPADTVHTLPNDVGSGDNPLYVEENTVD